MFRLIGILVVGFVLYVGWDAFHGWYAGEATPQETVEKVRGQVGDAISTDVIHDQPIRIGSKVPASKEEPPANGGSQASPVAPVANDVNSRARSMLEEALK